MNSSLWVIIALVSGIVGFLVGYSVSSYTGLRSVGAEVAQEAPPAAAVAEAPAQAVGAGGYGAPEPAKKPATGAGGYGAPEPEKKPEAGAGGYGAPEPVKKPAPRPARRKPAADAGGYGAPEPAKKPTPPAAGY